MGFRWRLILYAMPICKSFYVVNVTFFGPGVIKWKIVDKLCLKSLIIQSKRSISLSMTLRSFSFVPPFDMTNRMVWGLGRSIWPSLGCALWARWSAKATQWDAVAHWGGVYLTMWKAIVVSTTFGAYVVVPMIDCRLKSIFAMHEHPKEGGIL